MIQKSGELRRRRGDLVKGETFAKDLSKLMGSNTENLVVKAFDVTVGTKPGVKVEISNKFPLFESNVKLLPSTIVLSDSATSIKGGGGSFAGLPGAGFAKSPLMYSNGQSVWIPVVSASPYAPGEGSQYFLNIPLVTDPTPTPTGPPTPTPRR